MRIFKHIQYSFSIKTPIKNIKQAIKTQQKQQLSTFIQQKYVYEVYDKIAVHFSHTRYKPWPKIDKFLKELPNGSLVYDLGCGNGKYLSSPHLNIIGYDRCLPLLQKAQQKDNLSQLIRADCLALPIRSQSCDAFISIAVIHHFSQPSFRNKAISELCRITKVGGEGLIYVWAYEQDLQGSISRQNFSQQDIFVPWHLQWKYQQVKSGDIEEKKSVIYNRFYHVFKRGQLDNLIRQNEGLQIVESYYDKQNWCCKVKRIK